MGILVGAVHPPSLCYGAAGPNRPGKVGAVHLNRLRRLGSTAATWLGQSPLPAETLAIAVNRRYLIESIAAISKFVRVIRVHS